MSERVLDSILDAWTREALAAIQAARPMQVNPKAIRHLIAEVRRHRRLEAAAEFRADLEATP